MIIKLLMYIKVHTRKDIIYYQYTETALLATMNDIYFSLVKHSRI